MTRSLILVVLVALTALACSTAMATVAPPDWDVTSITEIVPANGALVIHGQGKFTESVDVEVHHDGELVEGSHRRILLDTTETGPWRGVKTVLLVWTPTQAWQPSADYTVQAGRSRSETSPRTFRVTESTSPAPRVHLGDLRFDMGRATTETDCCNVDCENMPGGVTTGGRCRECWPTAEMPQPGVRANWIPEDLGDHPDQFLVHFTEPDGTTAALHWSPDLGADPIRGVHHYSPDHESPYCLHMSVEHLPTGDTFDAEEACVHLPAGVDLSEVQLDPSRPTLCKPSVLPLGSSQVDPSQRTLLKPLIGTAFLALLLVAALIAMRRRRQS